MTLRALLLALAACGTSPQPAAKQTGAAVPPIVHDANPPQETKPVTAARVLATATDMFEYKVGNPHFQGRTIVRVTGDGKAEASSERGGKVDRYQGTVPADQLAALRASLTDHPLGSYQPKKRNAVPDEVTLEFTLVSGGQRSEASILHNERYEIDALGELVEVLQDIAKAVSGGKITH